MIHNTKHNLSFLCTSVTVVDISVWCGHTADTSEHVHKPADTPEPESFSDTLTEEEDTFTFDLNHLCLLIRNLPSYAVKGYISFGCVQDNLSFTGACPSARASSLWCCNQGRGRLCPQHPRHHWPGDHWQGHLQEFTGMNFPKALWTKFECFAPPCHPLYPW